MGSLKWSSSLFLICIVYLCIGIWLYIQTLWAISTTASFFLTVGITTAFYLSIKNSQHVHGLRKIWLWVMTVCSFLLTGLFALFLLLQLIVIMIGGSTHVLTTKSPDLHYEIDFYYFDAGAMGSFGIRGELVGPLGFKKHIYYERHATEVEVEWIDHETVVINGQSLNLKKGDYFGYTKVNK